jgi:alkylated DNA repair dioxygenase AlkB
MASAGQFEWSPELVADKTGKAFNRGANYNKTIVSQKAVVKGSDGTGRWGYHYYPTNLDGSRITPIPGNIKTILEKITGQDISDYDTVLINLYPTGRTLGWHTDVTEDYRNLDRDIISVSIGANADFTFANTPNDWISGDPAGKYDLGKINLNSGDIVSFGGPSRLISHTVTNVNGTTDLGPIDLSDSNVNPGFKGGLQLNNDWRLNFTFRVADPNNNSGKKAVSKISTQPSTSVKPGVQELFDSNFLIFAEAKNAEEVITKLINNNVIEKKCS